MISRTRRCAVVTMVVAATLALGANGAYDGAAGSKEHLVAPGPVPSLHADSLIPGATLTTNVHPEPAPPLETGHAADGDHFVLILGGIRPAMFPPESSRDLSSELDIYSSALTGTHPSSMPANTGSHAPVTVPLPAGWLLLVSGLAALRQARRAQAGAA